MNNETNSRALDTKELNETIIFKLDVFEMLIGAQMSKDSTFSISITKTVNNKLAAAFSVWKQAGSLHWSLNTFDLAQ